MKWTSGPIEPVVTNGHQAGWQQRALIDLTKHYAPLDDSNLPGTYCSFRNKRGCTKRPVVMLVREATRWVRTTKGGHREPQVRHLFLCRYHAKTVPHEGERLQEWPPVAIAPQEKA